VDDPPQPSLTEIARATRPPTSPDAIAGGLEERGAEPDVDGVLGLVVAVCGCGSGKSCGAIVLAPDGGERGEHVQALGRQGQYDQFAAERELLAEGVRGALGIARHDEEHPWLWRLRRRVAWWLLP